jgi:hypothetical protein
VKYGDLVKLKFVPSDHFAKFCEEGGGGPSVDKVSFSVSTLEVR